MLPVGEDQDLGCKEPAQGLLQAVVTQFSWEHRIRLLAVKKDLSCGQGSWLPVARGSWGLDGGFPFPHQLSP